MKRKWKKKKKKNKNKKKQERSRKIAPYWESNRRPDNKVFSLTHHAIIIVSFSEGQSACYN